MMFLIHQCNLLILYFYLWGRILELEVLQFLTQLHHCQLRPFWLGINLDFLITFGLLLNKLLPYFGNEHTKGRKSSQETLYQIVE